MHFGHNVKKECRAIISLMLRSNFPLIIHVTWFSVYILDIVLGKKYSNEEIIPISTVS